MSRASRIRGLNTAELTANPKYNSSPIAYEYREGKLKSTLTRGLKDLKSNSYKFVTALRGCNVRLGKRAGEFIFVARLIKWSRSESEYENALVTEIRPEARWSIPAQDEVFRKRNGGPNRCCVHALGWRGIRGEKPLESGHGWFLLKYARV